jgi:hypothetical protein
MEGLMKRFAASLFVAALFSATPAYAVPFTWTISGVADSGHWDQNDLTNLAYTLRLTTDSAAPDQNGFNDFGSYFNLSAEIEIATLGTRTLGNFTFIEQFSSATGDRLRIRGPNGGAESVLQIPLGTLGDPDFLSVWGPVQTLAVGVLGQLRIDDPGIPNAPFQLTDGDDPGSTMTVSTSTVPEPGTLALLGSGATIIIRRKRRRGKE